MLLEVDARGSYAFLKFCEIYTKYKVKNLK